VTKTIASETSNTRYFLTIDEHNHAVDCTCKDHYFRHNRSCKHMTAFNSQLVKVIAFASLKAQYDMRSQTVRDAKRTATLNYELSMGL